MSSPNQSARVQMSQNHKTRQIFSTRKSEDEIVTTFGDRDDFRLETDFLQPFFHPGATLGLLDPWILAIYSDERLRISDDPIEVDHVHLISLARKRIVVDQRQRQEAARGLS